jgi:hypothetical protein
MTESYDRTHELWFDRPEFEDDLCYTVRRGTSWASKGAGYTAKLKATRDFDENGDFLTVGEAKVGWVQVLPFHSITFPELHHLPDVQTTDDLLKEMHKCYNGFTPDEIVTVIYLEDIQLYKDGKQ